VNAAAIARSLAASGMGEFAGRVEWFDEVPSTSDYAKEVAASDAQAPPLLVVAGRQTAGRGRGANQWWSSDGALLWSLLIDPRSIGLGADRYGLGSLATAVAVCDATVTVAPSVVALLKWPNDVVTSTAGGARKLAGVLLEAPRRDRLVIGVGWNLNNDFVAAPPEVRARAASVAGIAGAEVDPLEALASLLVALERRLRQAASGDAALVRDCNERCVLRDRCVTIRSGDATIEGQCRGIADNGALLIDRGPTLQRVVSGTVLRYA
jgi:BirA family biotin operon repressor/biotin-[acetyl-CoA-carboxylase] ligase